MFMSTASIVKIIMEFISLNQYLILPDTSGTTTIQKGNCKDIKVETYRVFVLHFQI